MNEPGLTTVCRVCGTAFATQGDGFNDVCLGCLVGAALTNEAASESRAPVDAMPPRPGDLEAHGTRFAHYEILTRADGTFVELGRGAMGVTYRAVDTILHHELALKVVASEVAGNPRARARFLREAQAAASLRHPHIASVFFFGERPTDRQLFYAMELIEGETLQARVARAGGLPADTVVEIGAQVTDALAAAEARGLTHRDLKPANVMLSQGEKLDAKLIDFGLAKTILGEPDGATRQTAAGEFVGTPAFASPEHFNVWQDTDSRSDFYALGATLWYALTGRVPFAGCTPAEVHDRQLHAALPLEQLRAARVPRPVVDLLRSLLSPDPAGRPQTARALVAALADCRRFIDTVRPRRRWREGVLAVAMLGLILAGAAGGLIYHHVQPVLNPAPTQEKSIAVLPFDNLTVDKNDAFFTNGVQDEILTDLGRIADLKVISRNSVLGYIDPAKRPPDHEIGRALGVAYLLEGSVQRVGDRVHLTVRLNDAAHDRQFWSETFDRNLVDIFALQSEVATTIVGKLQAKLSPDEKSAIDKPATHDLQAFDLYLRARVLVTDGTSMTRAKQDLPKAEAFLKEAVTRDPNFLSAWCLLSEVHGSEYWDGFDHTPARLEQADAAVQAAVRIRPDAGEVHLARAFYYYHGFRDYARARGELDLARRTLPNSADLFAYTAYISRRQGHWEDAARELERSLELDPRNYQTAEQLATIYNFQHRYADESRLWERTLSITPGDPFSRIEKAVVAADARADFGPYEATLAALLAESPEIGNEVEDYDVVACERSPATAARFLASYSREGRSHYQANQSLAFVEGAFARWQGDPAKAQSALSTARAETEQSLQKRPDNGFEIGQLGLIDAYLGRKEEALREGRRACELTASSKDMLAATLLGANLAQIYAVAGEKDFAIAQIETVERTPNILSYGLLKLHPDYDSLRGDPRFEKILQAVCKPVDLSKFNPADFPPPTPTP